MLTQFELRLAARLLETAGETFSNHGSNDYNLYEQHDITIEAAVDFDRKLHAFNGTPENHDPEEAERGYQSDWFLMHYMAQRLRIVAAGKGGVSVVEQDPAHQAEEWRERAGERRKRIEALEEQLGTLCSKLGITREDAERLVG